jgi:hypothetical protein
MPCFAAFLSGFLRTRHRANPYGLSRRSMELSRQGHAEVSLRRFLTVFAQDKLTLLVLALIVNSV